MTIHTDLPLKLTISIKFKFQIQFLMFRHSDEGRRCWDRRQTVNLVSAGGLVEKSNAAKNNAVDKLAGSAAGRLAGWLAAGAAGG